MVTTTFALCKFINKKTNERKKEHEGEWMEMWENGASDNERGEKEGRERGAKVNCSLWLCQSRLGAPRAWRPLPAATETSPSPAQSTVTVGDQSTHGRRPFSGGRIIKFIFKRIFLKMTEWVHTWINYSAYYDEKKAERKVITAEKV